MRFRYEPLVLIVIHRDSIIHNLHEFKKINSAVAVVPVLKSNAYGHGLIQVAKILTDEQIPFLCIDTYAEALVLRNEKIRTPLLLIGYTPFPNMQRNALKNVSFGIMSIAELRRLSSLSRNVVIHLKIDTGMHRQGIQPEELDEALHIIEGNKYIVLDGVYSHLADADTLASHHTESQIERWNAVVREIKKRNPGVRFFHLGNTAGSYHSRKIDANVMRLGIGLYGVNTSLDSGFDLLPALEMKTRITSVRKIRAGESVGYNATFMAEREMTIATIPVGYAEGIDRRLSNIGTVFVDKLQCRFLGRVNMNMISIDVSSVANPNIDDEVLVISAERGAPNSIENVAKLCGATSYEMFVRLPAQIRRIVA
jgi:alanine racemase